MKKLLLMSTSVLFALAVSCRSDDSSDNSDKMKLQGNWQPDKIVTTTTANGGSTTTTVVTDDCQKKGRIIFTTDTSGKIKYYDNSNGTCTMLFDLPIEYTYNPDTKAFSITTNGNKMDGAVTTLTNSNMVVYYVDKSNSSSINKIEISATKVAN